MTSDRVKGPPTALILAIAVFIILDTLLLAPVLVVSFRWPDYLWAALGPYLALTLGGVLYMVYLAYKSGMLELTGAHMTGVGRYIAVTVGLTIGFIGLAVSAGDWKFFWVIVVGYVSVLVYGIYRLVKFQAENLALECQECGEVFQVSLSRWVLSPNMGSRKGINCAHCKKYTWARVVHRQTTSTIQPTNSES